MTLISVPSERNSYFGGGGVPIVFFLIHYTVIKETYYSLAIVKDVLFYWQC